jgi:hypothetical protein
MTAARDLPILHTSRWQNRKLAGLDVVPVGISRGTPRFKLPYRYRLLRLLAPPRETRGIVNTVEFERAYLHQLEKLGVEQIADRLERIGREHDGSPLVLLCYEDVHAGEFRHRRVFAGWWEEQTGRVVPELDDVEFEPHTRIQDTLFEAHGGQEG